LARFSGTVTVLLGALLLQAVAAFAQNPPPPAQIPATPLEGPAASPAALSVPGHALVEVGVGDTVKIDVFGRPEMDTTTYVADDGTIRLPLAGSVAVGGLSPNDAGKKIEDAYKAGQFLVDPHVTVTVVMSRSQRVSVLGEVRAPGRYPIESNTTVLDLLAQVGGVNEKGADQIYILRADGNGQLQRLLVDLKGTMDSKNGAPAVLQTLRGGDSILVPPAPTFYISGEVRSPAAYRIDSGMTVVQAIARAGGVTEKGSARRVSIKRKDPKGGYVVISAKSEEKIQPDDLITVKERIF
jgi:polysaccharide biosynthesis/export protein